MDIIQLAQQWSNIRQRKFRFTFVSIITGIFGIALVNNFVRTGIERYELSSSSVLTEAKVLSFKRTKPVKSRPITDAQIQFSAKDGKVIKSTITDYSGAIYEVGGIVSILYLPEKPDESPVAVSEFKFERWSWFTFGFLGLISLIACYLAGKGVLNTTKQPSD